MLRLDHQPLPLMTPTFAPLLHQKLVLGLRICPYWTDFNRAVLSAGRFLCPSNRFVEVFAIEYKDAAELLVRFSEWAIRGQCLAVANTHRCGI